MIRLLKYRSPLLALVLVFALFDIGLPVVLDTCPMEKALGAGACMLCHQAPPAGDQAIRLPGGSCCTPAKTIDRSRAEFEQTRPAPDREIRNVLVTPGLVLTSAPRQVEAIFLAPHSWSPPYQADIPILTSSLLI